MASSTAPATPRAAEWVPHNRVNAARAAIMNTYECDDDDVQVARNAYNKIADVMHADLQSNEGIDGATLADVTEFFVMDTRYHLRTYDESEDYDAFRKALSRGLKTLRIARKRSSAAEPVVIKKKAKRSPPTRVATVSTPADGTNPKPRGRNPSNYSWDYQKGHWVHDETGEIKQAVTKEDREAKKGTFARPPGKAPHGYEWDSTNGRWVSSSVPTPSVPIPSSSSSTDETAIESTTAVATS